MHVDNIIIKFEAITAGAYIDKHWQSFMEHKRSSEKKFSTN